MTCKNCGAEVAPGATFCSNCGTKVEVNEGYVSPYATSQPQQTVPQSQYSAQPQVAPEYAYASNEEALFNYESNNRGYLVAGIIICSVILILCIVILCMGSIPIPGVLLVLGIQYIIIGCKKSNFTVGRSGVEANWSGKYFKYTVAEIDFDNVKTKGSRLTLNRVNFNNFPAAKGAYDAIMSIKPMQVY